MFLCQLQANAQNLIPNGSFEINNGCPAQVGEVDKADGWVNWGVTPDYFHACANTITPAYGTPTNDLPDPVARAVERLAGELLAQSARIKHLESELAKAQAEAEALPKQPIAKPSESRRRKPPAAGKAN